jgi:hypothetical protein
VKCRGYADLDELVGCLTASYPSRQLMREVDTFVYPPGLLKVGKRGTGINDG